MLKIVAENEFDVKDPILCIEFIAAWCSPCVKMEPQMLKIEEEFSKDVKFLAIDVDKLPTIAQRFKIRTLPTVLLLKNGKEFSRISGVTLIDPLRKVFRDFVKNDDEDNYLSSAV